MISHNLERNGLPPPLPLAHSSPSEAHARLPVQLGAQEMEAPIGARAAGEEAEQILVHFGMLGHRRPDWVGIKDRNSPNSPSSQFMRRAVTRLLAKAICSSTQGGAETKALVEAWEWGSSEATSVTTNSREN